MEKEKNILIVSYNFPPITSAGVARVIAVTRHLASRGWKVTVATVSRSFCEESEGPAADIPSGVEVARVSSLEIDRFNPRRLLDGSGKGWRAGRVFRVLLFNLCRGPYALMHPIFSIPDRQVGWVPVLAMRLFLMMRRRKFDVILSSSPPHSSQLAILALKGLFGVKWVSDFRDPWTAPPYHQKRSPIDAAKRLLERLVLARSDGIVANTRGNKRWLLAEFPFLDDERVRVVTNGFDETLKPDPSSVSEDDVACDMLYAGEVYEGMLDSFVAALLYMRNRMRRTPPSLFVYGRMYEREKRLIEEAGLEDFIEYRGRVSMEKSIALMKRARSLLLVLPHTDRGKTWVPSKLYAYLYAGRPVVAIVPPGDAAEIIEETGAGVALTDPDPASIAMGIMDFLRLAERGQAAAGRREAVIREYSMERTVRSIEDMLEEVLAG